MKTRSLGNSGLACAPISLGTSTFGWTVDERTAFDILDRFVDRGFNLIDTADTYYLWAEGNHGGESETIIGSWLKARGCRDDVILATKVGEDFGDGRRGLGRDHILRSAEGSLRRLGTDHIDLYQAHIDDPDTPFDETLTAFRYLQETGKVRAIGASNYEAGRLRAALASSSDADLPRFESFQTLYNLCDRAVFEQDLQPLCIAENLAVLTYRSLARGFLTGKYRARAHQEQSLRGRDAIAYLDDRGRRILGALDEISKEHQATPAQISLAWLIARPSVAATVVSVSSVEQLDTVLDAADLLLTSEDITRLDTASAEG